MPINSKILLLGSSGFVGFNLARYLCSKGFYVAGLSRTLPKFSLPSSFHYRHICSDIENLQAFHDEFLDCSLVIDCAYSPIEDKNVCKSPNPDVLRASKSLAYCLQAAADNNVKKYIYLSSGGAVYGQQLAKFNHKEDDFCSPISKYGYSKLICENVCNYFDRLSSMDVFIVRPSNLYGPYSLPTRTSGVINVFAKNLLTNSTIKIFGDPSRISKDYIFIDDFCVLIERLICYNGSYKIFNFSSGQITNLSTIMSLIEKSVGSKFTFDQFSALTNDVQSFALDNTRLTSELGSFSYTPISIGINRTICWLKEQLNK